MQQSIGQAYRYLRYLLRASPLLLPRLVSCNLCGWQGRHFLSDRWHLHSICPKCQSSMRHRLLMATFMHIDDVHAQRILAGKDVLHFAPERALQRSLAKLAGRYVTADLNRKRRDLQLDLSDMPSVRTASYDVVIACDVLEHVIDDRRGLREMARILRPGGVAILTVPQQDGLRRTFEDPTVTTAAERERLFGQADHVRIYGADFADRVAESGFRVRVFDHTSFAAELVAKHVLFPPFLSAHPLATNHRKVFFAERS